MVTVAFTVLTAFSVITGLAALGAMREIVILRGELHAFDQLVRHPPPPGYLGDRIPDAMIRRLGDARDNDRLQIVSFVSPGCRPCEDLAEGLQEAL